MNLLKYILSGTLFLAGTLLTLSSCSDEESNGRDPQSLAAVFTTRLTGNTWNAGDRIGIAMTEAGKTLTTGATFSKYIAQSGESSTLSPDGSSNTLEYPEDGSDVNFVAFYPYSEEINQDLIISYQDFEDQSTAALMAARDVVYSNNVKAYNKDSETAELTFDHAMAKMIVNVKTSTDDDAVDLTKLSVEFEGMYKSVFLRLKNGTVDINTSEGFTTVAPYVSTQSSTAYTAQAIVAPHDATDSPVRKVNFTLNAGTPDERKTSVTIDSDLSFGSGMIHTFNYTLTLKPDQLAVEPAGVTISDWTGGVWNDYNYSVETTKSINVAAAADEYTQTFKTNYTGSVPLIYSTSATNPHAGAPTWITATQVPTASSPDSNGIITYTYKFETTANESKDDERVAYLHLNVEQTNLVITVTQKNDGPTVYAVGYEYIGGDEGRFWKNGKSQSFDSNALTSVFVDGNDVYIAGHMKTGEQLNPPSAYWKNGEAKQLTTGECSSAANSVFVSGDNVYVAGYEYINGDYEGRLWTNGNVQTLGNMRFVYGVFASETDVYVVGESKSNQAILWKNGEYKVLGATDGSTSTALAVTVSGGKVYVVGSQSITVAGGSKRSYAALWVDDVLESLWDDNETVRSSMARSVAVSGNDVYVVGYETDTSIGEYPTMQATLWKNGTAIRLASGPYYSEATSVCVLDGDVYIGGIAKYEAGSKEVATIWKNNETPIRLSDGTKIAHLNNIFVTP